MIVIYKKNAILSDCNVKNVIGHNQTFTNELNFDIEQPIKI